jgi:hypothetical protein
MLTMRALPEPLKQITARLRVLDMGPADHIRTKHEVKAWLETNGDLKEAEAIVVRAQARRQLQETQHIKQTLDERQSRGQRIDDE